MRSLYSSYGYGVYKRNQVNIGNPYKIKVQPQFSSAPVQTVEEDIETEPDNEEKDLEISQDIIFKAKEEAAIIRREAELEAERLLDEAKAEIKRVSEETYQKAKEEGYQEGEALAQEHYKGIIDEANEYREKCKKVYEDTLAALEHDMIELVLDIASRVVGDEIRKNKEAIVGVIKDTINSCYNHEKVVLRVSCEDYEFVDQNRDRILSEIPDIEMLEIKKDSTLKKGSCIVDTGFGLVDGSVDTRMESIKKAFYDILGENGQDG